LMIPDFRITKFTIRNQKGSNDLNTRCGDSGHVLDSDFVQADE